MKKQLVYTKKYTLIYCPNHPKSNKMGYIYYHRYLIEQKIGRLLNTEEEVHHLDFDKTNNDINNLILCKDSKEHFSYHHFKGNKNRKCGYYKEIGEIVINTNFINKKRKTRNTFYRLAKQTTTC